MNNYVAWPGERFSYDVDGTRVLFPLESGLLGEYGRIHKEKMIAPTNEMVMQQPLINNVPDKVIFVFPEPRDLYGAFIAACAPMNYDPLSQSTTVGAVGSGAGSPPTGPGINIPVRVETSTDTTTGQDGTWTMRTITGANPSGFHWHNNGEFRPSDSTLIYDQGATYYSAPNIAATANLVASGPSGTTNYGGLRQLARTKVQPFDRGNIYSVKGVRIFLESVITGAFGNNSWDVSQATSFGKPQTVNNGFSPSIPTWNIACIHLYGQKYPLTTSSVQFWHPVSNAPLQMGDVDWGDVPIASTDTRQFRVKNSNPLTARSVTITLAAPDPDAQVQFPQIEQEFSLSTDGVNYGASLSLGDLGSGVISAPLWVKRVTPYKAENGPFFPRLALSVRTYS